LRFPLEVVDAIVAAIGRDKTAIRIAPFHVLQQTLDSDRVAAFPKYAEELEKRGLAYVHMVEPRYDQLSTEGAFSGKIERLSGAGGDCISDVQEVKEISLGSAFSLWTFRRILRNTLLIGAGGYDSQTAREAISQGSFLIAFHIAMLLTSQIGRVDLVAFGRHFTSNPDLPRRIFANIPLAKYDRKTFYTPGIEGYLGWKEAAEV
jgi:2,4-dienoyl-CoA reductase-like NADH-dependent reductase (Old Yellow Enzyme family)